MSLPFLSLDRTPMFTHPHPDHFYMPSIDDPHPPQNSVSPAPLPKPGQTRCYWTLLSSGLEFLYIDPVLRFHLDQQADAILGRRLLDFVHPDEHTSAHQDLGKVLESRTLHGSVTRVRFSRLGRMRARLGYTGEREKFADEDKVSFDEDYMACDLVINWAAEGLVLCFIHAVVDLSPADNDEYNRTPWTNWCGTPELDNQEGERLHRALFSFFPHASQNPQTPARIFQVLKNTADRPPLVSWPAQGYAPADYGKLANGVQIGGANGSDAKTSCTRRYKAQQILNAVDGGVHDVESIFIPHGHIIFACHKSVLQRPRRGSPNPYPVYAHSASFYGPPEHHYPQYYPTPNVTVPSQGESYPGAPANGYSYPPHHNSGHQPQPMHTMQTTFSLAHRSSPPGLRGTSSQSPYPQQEQWSSNVPEPPYLGRSSSAEQTETSYVDEVPPPRSRGPRSSPEMHGGHSRGGHPPPGILKCAACKSATSPEWRKGPSGKKDLCNACGLRYSRAKAKKEGVPSVKRRKETLKIEDSFEIMSSAGKRRNYMAGPYSDFGSDVSREFISGTSNTNTPSPSPPNDYTYQHPPHPSHQHIPATHHMYHHSAESRHPSMYMPPSQHHDSSHVYQDPLHPQQHHAAFFAAPPQGDFASTSHPGSSVQVTTPISSYERTGIHTEQRSLVPNP